MVKWEERKEEEGSSCQLDNRTSSKSSILLLLLLPSGLSLFRIAAGERARGGGELFLSSLPPPSVHMSSILRSRIPGLWCRHVCVRVCVCV